MYFMSALDKSWRASSIVLYMGRITAEGLLVTAKGETCNLTERGPSVWP